MYYFPVCSRIPRSRHHSVEERNERLLTQPTRSRACENFSAYRTEITLQEFITVRDVDARAAGHNMSARLEDPVTSVREAKCAIHIRLYRFKRLLSVLQLLCYFLCMVFGSRLRLRE